MNAFAVGNLAQVQDVQNPLIVPSGLIYYWSMKEGSGSLVHDQTGNKNNLSVIGNTKWGTSDSRTGNTSFTFDGSTYLAFRPASSMLPTIPVGTSARTVVWWFRITTNANTEMVSYGQNLSGNRWGAGYYTGGGGNNIGIEINGSSRMVAWGYNTSWHHMAIVYPGGSTDVSSITVYFDGYPYGVGSGVTINTILSNYQFVLGSIPISDVAVAPTYNLGGAFSEVRFYNRALSQAEIRTLYTSTMGGGNYHPAVLSWRGRVLSYSGTADVSTNTMNALDTFMRGLDTAGLTPKMKMVNCMVPDNLVACMLPLLYPTAGAESWTNTGFVAGDLTVNGLKGDGSTKFTPCNCNANDVWSSEGNWGLTAYNTANTAYNARDFGVNPTATGFGTFILYCGWSDGNTYGQGDGGAAGDFLTYANGGNSTGYWSFNCVSTTDKRLYLGRSGTGHNQVGINTNANSVHTIDNYPIRLFRAGQDAGYVSDKRFSFAAAHLGLTAAESATLYSLVQAMRTSLGGGYV